MIALKKSDERVPHLSYNYHYVNLNRDYVNQPIGLQLHVLRNSCPDSKYPSYVTELLFIKSLQGKEFYKCVELSVFQV